MRGVDASEGAAGDKPLAETKRRSEDGAQMERADGARRRPEPREPAGELRHPAQRTRTRTAAVPDGKLRAPEPAPPRPRLPHPRAHPPSRYPAAPTAPPVGQPRPRGPPSTPRHTKTSHHFASPRPSHAPRNKTRKRKTKINKYNGSASHYSIHIVAPLSKTKLPKPNHTPAPRNANYAEIPPPGWK